MSDTSEFTRSLDAGIDAMRAGQTVSLNGDGELAELLEVAAALESHRLPEPSPAFKRELAARISTAPKPATVPSAQAPGGGPLGWLPSLWRRTQLVAAVAVAVTVFVAVGAVGASADALPGDTLYPVKRGVERVSLMFAGGADALALRMDLAERRLDEAVAAPDQSGPLLAEFSREVTAALVEADGLMAEGLSREQVAPPVLEWLIRMRGQLIEHRETMPPTAWRGALALVDEAILALRSGGELSAWPVPRLRAIENLLAMWATTDPWIRPVGGPEPSALLAAAAHSDAANRDASRGAPGAGSGRANTVHPGPPTLVPVTRNPSPSAPTSRPEPTSPPAGAGGDDDDGSNGNGGNDGSNGNNGGDSNERVPTPTDQPADPPPSPSPDPPSPSPDPGGPTAVSTASPSASPEPGSPTAVPSESPTAEVTTTPTDLPAAGPVIERAYCHPNPVWIGSVSNCHVVVSDPVHAVSALTFEWTADVGEMLHPDRQTAQYYADLRHGVQIMKTWITVTVSNPDGESDAERYEISILGGQSGS